tara:strand:- start:244 stop:411 length:168 start_codon:yes stop_codon:yes gene_type:complete
LIRPQAAAFYDRFEAVADAVSLDQNARMPGQGKTPATTVDVPDALWEMVGKLAAK